MRVAAAVWRREDDRPEKILARIERSLALCAREGVEVVVFPALIGCFFGDGAAFLERVQRLSAAYPDLVICPGSWWERADVVWHASALIRGGEVLLRQRQLYLARWEREEGLARGEDLAFAELGAESGGWRTAIILSTDVFYPQVSRYAALSGADLILSPVAIRAGRENFPTQISGLWASVQANLFFALESGFKGTFRGRTFASRSAIHAPLAMTPQENGFLVLEGEVAPAPEEGRFPGREKGGSPGTLCREEREGGAPRSSPPVQGEFLSSREGGLELLVAELDPERRRAARRPFDPLRQLNPEAYRGLYLKPAGDPGEPRAWTAAGEVRSVQEQRPGAQPERQLEERLKRAHQRRPERQGGARSDEQRRQGEWPEKQQEEQRRGRMERHLERCLERYLARRLDPERIRRYLRTALEKALPIPVPEGTAGWPPPASGLVRVSCVQRQIRLVRRVEEYVDHLHGFVREAAVRGSRLVVFPEYNFFDLFGLIPGFALVDRLLNARAQASLGRSAARAGAEAAASGGAGEPNPGGPGSSWPDLSAPAQGGTSAPGCGRPGLPEPGHSQAGPPARLLYTLFSALARPAEAALFALMGELARRYGLYVYTGTYLLKEGGRLYNAGSLLGPDGEVIGTQKKIHLMDFEADLGLARGDRLEVRDLAGLGRVAFPVCMDATYFETFHLAGRAGAEIVLLPIANSEEYHPWKALRGIWPRVQESYVFGLKASLNGWLGGMHFTGKAGIFAPLALTERRDGVLALAGHWEGAELVTADLDLAALRRAREDAEYWGDVNPAFEASYWERTYGRGRIT